MKVLLCGEGKTDFGYRDYQTGEWVDGPVQILMSKISREPIEIESIEREEVQRIKLQRQIQGRNLSHGSKALKLAILAREKGKDVAACYVDADKNSGECGADPIRCKRRFEEVYQDIHRGFNLMDNHLEGLAIVPLKMIESWLLTDEQAFTTTFNKKIPTNPSLPTQPEIIWGDEDNPDSNHPKCYLKRVLTQYVPKIEERMEIFRKIAENSRVEILCVKCAISFKKFYDDMQNIG